MKIGRYGLVVLAFLAPSLLGGYPLFSALALGGASILLLFLAINRPTGLSPNVRLLVNFFLVFFALGIVQLLPLPAVPVGWLSPDAIAERADNYARLGLEPPPLGTLSRAPYEGSLWIIRVLSPLAAFFASLSLIRRLEDRVFVVRSLVLLGGSFALTGLVHRGLGAEELFGFYRPIHAEPELLTPLLNSNHLAGLFVLTAPMALGFSMKGDEWSGLSLGIFFLMAFAVLLTGSRGGIAAFFIALLVFALIRRGSNQKKPLPIPRPFFLSLFSVALLLGIHVGRDAFLRDYQELKGEQLDAKLILFERGLGLVLDAPIFGYGRGAFGVMMSDRYPFDEEVRFAENAILQRAADIGLPLAAVFFFGFGYLFYRVIRGRRSPLSAGLIAGLIGLALQNLVDYSLELPGLSVPAAVALGALVIPRHRQAANGRQWTKAALIGLVACLAVSLAAAANYALMHTPREALQEIAAERRIPSLDAQRRLLDAHPRNAGVALGLAHFHRLYEPEKAGPYLNRALELAPYWSRTHLELAEWLLSQGQASQAAIHLRAAASIDHRSVRELVCVFVAQGAYEEVVGAAPPAPYDARYYENILRCVPGHSATSEKLESLILSRDPDHLEAHLRTLQRACRDEGARAEGSERLRALSRVHPRDPRPAFALLTCLKLSGDRAAAEKEAKAIIARMPYTQERVREILSR